ncbi:MAG: hypothetical protein II858_01690 [Bacteroidales bacterium]|nr:hypothetical protein [Bacteroidales bacterium]
MKKLLKIILVLVVLVLAVRYCANKFGSVISLPGMTEKETTEEDGGWFRQKEKTEEKSVQKSENKTASSDEIRELERELGIGVDKHETTQAKTPTTTTTTSTTATTTASTPLTFKGIPMKGSLSSFGSELVRAGFRNAGNGTYTGTFAGYDGCKITPSGSNPVQEVRVDFPVISDWDALEKAYDSMQASLTQKYGIEPKTKANSNLAVYELPNGTISLDADVTDRSSWHVILTYANAPSKTLTTPSTGNPIDDL